MKNGKRMTKKEIYCRVKEDIRYKRKEEVLRLAEEKNALCSMAPVVNVVTSFR